MNRIHFACLFTSILCLGFGCHRPTAPTSEKTYEITGQVMSIGADRQSVTLDHEDVPGLMQAMQMEFKVADSQVLDGIANGDSVQGQLEVKAGDYTVTALRKR